MITKFKKLEQKFRQNNIDKLALDIKIIFFYNIEITLVSIQVQ